MSGVRLDSLNPGDEFRWCTTRFRLVGLEATDGHDGRPCLPVLYLEWCGPEDDRIAPLTSGLMPADELVYLGDDYDEKEIWF